MNHIPVIEVTSLDEGKCYISINKVQYVANAQGATDAQAKIYFHGGVSLLVTETAFHVKHLIEKAGHEDH